MVNFRGMVALASIVALVAFGSVGCDDNDSNGSSSSSSTTTLAPATTTTMAVVTTTSLPVVTTTLPPMVSGSTCDATVSVTSNETMGSLQYNLDYSGAQPGGFMGSAGTVSCVASPAIAGAIITFNDDEPALTLRTGVISLGGFTGPTAVQTCVYLKGSGADPVPGDFTLTLVDAADPSFNPLTPTLAVTITNCVPGCVGPECGPGVTTTTTTSTTTTSTTTSTTVIGGVGQFLVSFDVDTAGNYGALQFNADYSGAPGVFNGSAATVTCSPGAALTGAIVTFNDDEPALTLRAGIISLGGFAGPTTLATCTFDSTGATPVAGDFGITVVDASDPGLNPIAPLPTISVSSIVAAP